MADMENSSSTGNTSCDSAQSGVVDVLPGHHKRENVSSIDSRDVKRRKTLEQNYLASTVGFELARAGKSAPLVRSNPQVDHVQNKSLTTPFLVAQAPLKGIFQTADYCSNMHNIISACSSFYQIPAETLLSKKETGICREELCTSSVSGDSEDDTACVDLSKADQTSSEPSYITMGDALSISMEPRYVSIANFFTLRSNGSGSHKLFLFDIFRVVTTAIAPFVVVHVNAAFTRTTGMSSITALGRPLHELVKEDSAITGLNSLMNMHNKVLTVRSDSAKKASLARNVTVVPVGPNAENVTHFTLKLADSGIVQLSNYGRPTPSKGLSIQVHA
jgi:hypothetical protein